MRRVPSGGCVAAGLVVLLSMQARAGENSIALEKLPSRVRQSADRAIPGAKWTDATWDKEGRTVVYEIEGTNADGDDVSASVDTDGRVLETCLEVDLSDVPRVVKNALREKMPGIKVREVMSATRDGAISGYYFDARRNNEDVEVFVSTDGRRVEIED